MNIIMFFYVFLLFVLLTPGILISLPPKGSIWTMAIVHGFVFAFILCLTKKFVWETSMYIMNPEVVKV